MLVCIEDILPISITPTCLRHLLGQATALDCLIGLHFLNMYMYCTLLINPIKNTNFLRKHCSVGVGHFHWTTEPL